MGEIKSRMGRFSGIKKQNGKIWSPLMGPWRDFRPSHFALLIIFKRFVMGKDVYIESILQYHMDQISLVLVRIFGIC